MYNKLLGTPLRQTLFFVLLSLLISSPGILSGFMNDDYYFLTPLLSYDTPFEYYEFATKVEDARLVNWWREDGFQMAFFRPLSSLSLYLDFEVFQANKIIAHLHSALWFVLMLVGAFRILRVLLPPKNAALASAIFAVGSYHATTLTWISARHAAIGGAFSVWAAYYYLRFRMERRYRLWVSSLALFVLALFSSEVALTLPIFAFSFELAFTDTPLTDRLKSIAPFAFFTLVYLLFYKLAGYGPFGSDMYINPLHSPGRYLMELPERVIGLMGSYLLGIPVFFAHFPGAKALPLIAGLLGLGGLLTALFVASPLDSQRKRLVKWLGLLMLLGMIPAGAGMPDGRETPLSSMAVSALVAILVSRLLGKRKAGKRSVPAVMVAELLLFGVLVLSVLIRLVMAGMMQMEVHVQDTAGKERLGCEHGASVYVINADFTGTFYDLVIVSSHQGIFFEHWYVLSEPAHPIAVTYQGENRLELDGREAPLIHDMMFRLFRSSDEPFEQGDVLKRHRLKITVTNVDNGRPMKAVFEIPELTNRKKVCLLSFQEGRLRPFELSAVGETKVIDWGVPNSL